MKIACFGDFHGNKFKEFDEPSSITGSKRLDIQVDALNQIKSYCLNNSIKILAFSGDFYNTRGKVDTVVYNALYDCIKDIGKAGITVLMIAGNHDQYDNSDVPDNSLHPFKELQNVFVYDQPTMLEGIPGTDIKECNIACVPYSKNIEGIKNWVKGASEISKVCLENTGIPTVLLMHAGVSGAFVGTDNYPLSDAFTPEELFPDIFKYIILGHFHKPQYLSGYNNAFYTGSPLQHSFSDEGEQRGFYVVDTSKRWDIQFVPIKSPMFYTINFEDLETMGIDLLKDGNYIRILCNEKQVPLVAPMLPPDSKYKLVIQKEYKEEVRVNVKVGMPFNRIISEYAKQFKPEAEQVGLSILAEVEGVK